MSETSDPNNAFSNFGGLPITLVVDSGTYLNSQSLKDLMKNLGIQIIQIDDDENDDQPE